MCACVKSSFLTLNLKRANLRYTMVFLWTHNFKIHVVTEMDNDGSNFN